MGKLIKDGCKVDDLSRVGIFVIEHIIQYMLIPGQIENWVVIVDIQKQGLSEIPISAFGNVLKMFSYAYKSRSAKIFILNATFFTATLWKAISLFLDKGTRVKVTLSSDAFPPELKALVHPAQLPTKLGGWMEPVKAWPPIMPNRDFVMDEKFLASECDYKKALLSNPYMVPSPELANEMKSTRNKIETNKTLYLIDKIVTLDSYNNLVSIQEYTKL